jgi:hypothetical protein
MCENLYALQFIEKVKKKSKIFSEKKKLSYSDNNDVIYNERDQLFNESFMQVFQK